MKDEEIINCIKNTGFDLEYKISKILEKENWNVITNRYYIDDITNQEREIDILAYKYIKHDDFSYCTTLILSCKKSIEQFWTFLTKEININNPNINFYPNHLFTLNKILNHYITNEINISKMIKEKLSDVELSEIYKVDRQLFAFQQINEKNKTKNNDKDIYNSIVSVIKSLEYEKKFQLKKNKTDTIFNFFLLSIFDGQFKEIKYSDNESEISDIEEVKYINRHIINNKEDFYRVHFINFNSFNKYLNHYINIHNWYSDYFLKLYNNFFIDFSKSQELLNLFKNEVYKETNWYLNIIIFSYNIEKKIEYYIFHYDTDKNIFKIEIPIFDLSAIDKLNQDEKIRIHIKNSLLKWYKYNGDFEFIEEQIPF